MLLIFLFLSFFEVIQCSYSSVNTDVCIYGGTSAGIIAAYTAKKLSKSVILIEPGTRIGGLTAGGLGWTDFGEKDSIQGYSRDFYKRIGHYYNQTKEKWTFEPKIALKVYKDYLKEVNVTVLYEHKIQLVEKTGTKIHQVLLSDKQKGLIMVKAKVYIDCTYEGDLMAFSNVSYAIGREGNQKYNESHNGVQLLTKHQFPDGIDPYKIAGKPESGLLWGISKETLQPKGTGDKKIQAYNFRITLTKDPKIKINITKPNNYDPSKYDLLLRLIEKGKVKSKTDFLKVDFVTSTKTDINNQGPFSTDFIGMNYEYPEANYSRRKEIYEMHKDYTLGLLYFVGNDVRVPKHIRDEMSLYGYPSDEYIENHHFTPQLYIRESRRMIGQYVMTEHNCFHHKTVQDGIVNASYTVDSHNVERIVLNGMVKNEGDVQIHGIQPYYVSYGAIIPKRSECTNLLVPVCLSASHSSYGSIRMEPVFMELGQAAGYAAAKAIDLNLDIQKVDAKLIRDFILKNP